MSRRKRIFRIILHISLILVWCFVVYLWMGAPSFTAEMAMHRMEARYWVGPSRVIAVGVADELLLMVGETDYGHCFYEYRDGLMNWDKGELTYISRDDPRICFMPSKCYYGRQKTVLPVYSICTVPDAVSARLTLISDVTVETAITLTHTVSSQLYDGVYFRFEVEMTDLSVTVPQAWNLWLMGEHWGSRYVKGTLRMEYFDRNGNLLETQVAEYPASQ